MIKKFIVAFLIIASISSAGSVRAEFELVEDVIGDFMTPEGQATMNESMRRLIALVRANYDSLVTKIDAVNSVKSGTIVMYGAAAAPSGYLLCDGSAVSRTTYSDLFDVISTTYGTGDGSTTFNVPNMKSRMPIGLGQGSGLTNRSLNASGGAETADIAHTHTHTLGGATNIAGYTDRIAISSGVMRVATLGAGGVVSTFTGGLSSSGSSSQNIMAPFLTVNFIIKT